MFTATMVVLGLAALMLLVIIFTMMHTAKTSDEEAERMYEEYLKRDQDPL